MVQPYPALANTKRVPSFPLSWMINPMRNPAGFGRVSGAAALVAGLLASTICHAAPPKPTPPKPRDSCPSSLLAIARGLGCKVREMFGAGEFSPEDIELLGLIKAFSSGDFKKSLIGMLRSTAPSRTEGPS